MGLHCWGGFRPEAVTPLTPAPVERLWRITGLNHELSMLSIDRCGFASRVSVNDNVHFLNLTTSGYDVIID